MTSYTSHSSSNQIGPSQSQGLQSGLDDLVRVFNTALISSKSEGPRDFTGEIYSVIESPAFRAVLGAIRQHARASGISERESAESIIKAFRKIDQIWEEYVYQEGLERLRKPTQGNH